nr:radical SAM protein [Salinarchaeum laminariae]
MLKDRADVDDAQQEWGSYVLYRDDLPDRLDSHLNRKRTWKRTSKGCGIVGISFATDCYMDGRAGKITREVVDVLSDHERYARILTRNPILSLQDLDVFKGAGQYVTVGSSIPSMDAEEVGAIEPQAPAPEHRVRGLEELNEAGVQTFVSMSPTYPTQSKEDLRAQLMEIAECDPSVVFHEPINPRGANFKMTVDAARSADQTRLADELERLQKRDRWVEYSLNHLRWMQELGDELDMPVHLWPDKQLLKYADPAEREWLEGWRERQSPEDFANRDTPSTPMPDHPGTANAAGVE